MAPPLACIVCGCEIKAVFPLLDSEPPEQPAQPLATMFTSRGNYGSSVYDPGVSRVDSEHISINVCDSCLRTAAAKGHVSHASVMTFERRTYKYRSWEPEPESEED